MTSSARVISVARMSPDSDNARPPINIMLKQDRQLSAKLTLRHFSQDPHENPGAPVIELETEDLNILLPTTCLAACLCAPTSPPEASETLSVHEDDLKRITLSVEKEIRGFNVQTMKSTDFIYRVNVHTRFTKNADKGGTVSKTLFKDTSGSKILIKGPYAKNVQDALMALTDDLEAKIIMRRNMPTGFEGSGLLIKPINHRVEEKESEEPRMAVGTWAAVSVRVVDG